MSKKQGREDKSSLEEYDSALDKMDKPTELVCKRKANPKIKSIVASKMTKGTIGKGVVKGLMAMKTSQDTGLYCKTSESLCSTESIDEPKTSSVAGSGTPSTLSGPPSIPYRGGLQMNKPYLKSATDFHPKKSSEPKKK